MKKKHIALLLTCVMLLGVAIGGTFAWLTDKTPEVKNTFTTSDIEIALAETTTDYQMIPGWDIAKDPKVTVEAGSEDCYVFVKIDMANGYELYMNGYTVDRAWRPLVDDKNTEDTTDDVIVSGVFYQEVTGLTADWSDYVLEGKGTEAFANGYVTVLGSVTKSMMEAIDGVDADGNAVQAEIDARPTLTFTAYASQLWQSNNTKFNPYVAWTNIFPANS